MSENPILSAALEDAEGHVLVEKILVERVTACVAAGLHSWGKATCGSCGITPLPDESNTLRIEVGMDQGWQGVGIISLDVMPDTSRFDDLFKDPGTLVPKKMSASVQMQWQDVSYEFMAALMGYNSAAEMREEVRKREELASTVDDVLSRRIDAPPVDVDSVRWAPATHRLINNKHRELKFLERLLGIEE